MCSFPELMTFTLPSFSSCDWSHWGLTPLPAGKRWKHGSLSPRPVRFAWFTDERWSSCQSFVHSHCLTRLVFHIPNSQHPNSPIPHSATLLQKVTRSHRRLRLVAMRMPWQPWRIAHGARVSNGCNGLNFGGCEEKLHVQFQRYFCFWAVGWVDGQLGSVQNVSYFQPLECPRHWRLDKTISELVNWVVFMDTRPQWEAKMLQGT